jgi:hypothetical protein
MSLLRKQTQRLKLKKIQPSQIPVCGSGRANWTSSLTGAYYPGSWFCLFNSFAFRLVYAKSSDMEYMNAFIHAIPFVTRYRVFGNNIAT